MLDVELASGALGDLLASRGAPVRVEAGLDFFVLILTEADCVAQVAYAHPEPFVGFVRSVGVAVADCDEADIEDAFRCRYEVLCRFQFVSVIFCRRYPRREQSVIDYAYTICAY